MGEKEKVGEELNDGEREQRGETEVALSSSGLTQLGWELGVVTTDHWVACVCSSSCPVRIYGTVQPARHLKVFAPYFHALCFLLLRAPRRAGLLVGSGGSVCDSLYLPLHCTAVHQKKDR